VNDIMSLFDGELIMYSKVAVLQVRTCNVVVIAE